jgi:hypothetical protein
MLSSDGTANPTQGPYPFTRLATLGRTYILSNMDRDNVSDKNGEPIHEGDYAYTRIRGGTHEGKVC